MANAVVWGGMLAVIKDACSTRTLIPGTSKESGILLPEELLITVSGDRLKRIAEAGLKLFMVTI